MKKGLQLATKCVVYLQLLAQIEANKTTQGRCKAKVYLRWTGQRTRALLVGSLQAYAYSTADVSSRTHSLCRKIYQTH
jgi:hypothetical protein